MRWVGAFFLLFFGIDVSRSQPLDGFDSVPLNHVQVLGSHNSYRKDMDRGVIRFLRGLDPFFGKKSTPADQLNYRHEPFDIQFGQYAIRCLEIDIHYDPNGGLYYKRQGNRLAWKGAKSHIEELKQPGMKVLHIADIDYNTHYLTFKQALVAVRDWLQANPASLPIYILVEPKEDGPGNHIGLGYAKVLPFDKTALEKVDEEIAEVFAQNQTLVYRPDEMRGEFASLRQRLEKVGWPKVGDVRGKAIFIINGGMRHTEAYSAGRPDFSGRWMFSFSQAGRPDAAFVKRDNPFEADVRELVTKGYVIRTRTDSPGEEAPLNSTIRREKAFETGAQMLCTDYYKPDPQLSPYMVQLPCEGQGLLNFLSPQKGACVK